VRREVAGTWDERTIGGDRVLEKRRDSADTVFALGPAAGDPDRARRLSRILETLSDRLVSLFHCSQVHGSLVHRVDEDTAGVVMIGDGDGMVTDRSGVGLAVWTADCVPVLLAGRGIVAAVHSGWRGCASDVVGAAITIIRDDFGVDPISLRAVLGPAVCGRCYEVGPEVPSALGGFGLDERRWRRGDRVDLRGFLTARLEALGVPTDRIETIGGCTVESPELASYRRDGAAAGRQWAMVFLDRT
jgi:YfiH family protein